MRKRLSPRDVAAYLLSRADAYEMASPCWVALADAAHNVIQGDVSAAKNYGSLDADVYRRVDAWAKRESAPIPVQPNAGVDAVAEWARKRAK